MSALKKVSIENTLHMIPECHPDKPFNVLYVPDRGGDHIIVKCSDCYRVFFNLKLPNGRT